MGKAIGATSQAAQGALPKRMVVSYFAYGAYMPDGPSGVPAPGKKPHEWSWWPCKDPGPY